VVALCQRSISIVHLVFLSLVISFQVRAQNISVQFTQNHCISSAVIPSPIVKNLASLSSWVACSVAWSEIKSLNDAIAKNSDYFFVGAISDSLVKKHVIIVIQQRGSLWPTLGQTCIVDNDSTVTVLSLDYEKGFNKMILKENIRVETFDMAEKIAMLFIRAMLPLISEIPLFFVDELAYATFDEYISVAGRSEMKNLRNVVTDFFYCEYKTIFKKDIEKRKWFTQVGRKDNVYIANLLTAGRISVHNYVPAAYDRILNWEVIVYPNGTIKAKLPKGIKVHTIYD